MTFTEVVPLKSMFLCSHSHQQITKWPVICFLEKCMTPRTSSSTKQLCDTSHLFRSPITTHLDPVYHLFNYILLNWFFILSCHLQYFNEFLLRHYISLLICQHLRYTKQVTQMKLSNFYHNYKQANLFTSLNKFMPEWKSLPFNYSTKSHCDVVVPIQINLKE